MVEGEEGSGVESAQIVTALRGQARLEARRQAVVRSEPGQVPARRPRVSDELEVVGEGARDHVLGAVLQRRRRQVAWRDEDQVAGVEVASRVPGDGGEAGDRG